MKKLTYHIFIFCLFGSITSCLGPADPLKVPEPETKLLVKAPFTDGDFFKVILSKSSSSNEEDIYVKNAEIQILSESDELLETLTFNQRDENEGEPYYTSLNLTAEVGVLYKIRVETPNYPITTAESIIPFPSNIEVGNYDSNTTDQEIPDLNRGLFIRVGIEDKNIDEQNYFLINCYHLAKVDAENITNYNPNLPMKMRKLGSLAPGILLEERGVLLTDNSFPGGHANFYYELIFDQEVISNLTNQENFGSILVELRTIEENYYRYLTSIADQKSNDERFFEDNAIFSNIENGLGYFGGFSIKTDTIQIER